MFNIPTPGPTSAPSNKLFNEGEKRRFIGYVGAMLVVIGGFGGAYLKFGSGDDDQRAAAEQEVEQLRSQIALPALRVEQYREQAKDATQPERSVLETAALDTALADARLYSTQHFEPMNGVDLTQAVCAELAERSLDSRGKILRVRGELEELIQFEAAPGVSGHFRGRVQLEDGAHCFVAFVTAGETELGAGDFLMLEGFFLKNQAQNVLDAGWIEGPLVVGPRAVRSSPALGPITALSPDEFLDVEDDSLQGGFRTTPPVYWKLLAYARDFDPNSVDWSKAPLLDGNTMQQLAADPAKFRGKPMRIPECVVQDIWRQAKRENPARLTHLTEGWLGSYEWLRTIYPVVRFDSPLPNPGLRKSDQMTARGFFLRIHAYESAGRGTQMAPLFVLAGMESFTPPKDSTLGTILAVLGVSFVGILVMFILLMRRDENKALALNRQLVERRRMRRQQTQRASAQ